MYRDPEGRVLRAVDCALRDAALLAGLPYERMKAYASAAVDPIPHIAVGRAKKLIRMAAIPAYMESREER